MPGDDDFQDFYQASYPRLVGQLTVLTGSLEDAEDAVQEAFARASIRWGRLRAYEAPEAWVRRVALNLASSGRRRTRRHLAALARLGAATPEPAAGVVLALVAGTVGVERLSSRPASPEPVPATTIPRSPGRS
jgi:RNA polymerase sigma-70 factor (ECF subfamily)